MNKYKNEIEKLEEIAKVVLNPKERIRSLASRGIVMPMPQSDILISIIYFLQFDENKEIAKNAKEKFYNLPESSISGILNKNLHKFLIVGILEYISKKENQSVELFKNVITNVSFNPNICMHVIEKLSIELKTYLSSSLNIIIKYPKLMNYLVKTDIAQDNKLKLINFAKRNNITLELEEKKEQKVNNNIQTYIENIESKLVKKILFSENKIKLLASKGIIKPKPSISELLTILFYLQYDENELISKKAMNNFYRLPKKSVEKALDNNLDSLVLLGIFKYFIKLDNNDFSFFMKIISQKLFKFSQVSKYIHLLSLEIREQLASAFNIIEKNPILVKILLKSNISKASKEKLLEFVKRHKNIIEEKSKVEKKSKVEEKEINSEDNNENDKDIKASLLKQIGSMTMAEKVQLAMKGGMEARGILIRQSNRMIVEAVIRSPRITDQEVLKFSGDKNMAQEVIKYISNHNKWMRNHEVKMNIILNPKTPLGRARNLLLTLQPRDIKKISKMTGISGTLKNFAKEYIKKKEKKK